MFLQSARPLEEELRWEVVFVAGVENVRLFWSTYLVLRVQHCSHCRSRSDTRPRAGKVRGDYIGHNIHCCILAWREVKGKWWKEDSSELPAKNHLFFRSHGQLFLQVLDSIIFENCRREVKRLASSQCTETPSKRTGVNLIFETDLQDMHRPIPLSRPQLFCRK